jgi:hypothetical protein
MDPILMLVIGGFLGNVISSVSSSISADPEQAKKFKYLLIVLGAVTATVGVVYTMVNSGTLVAPNDVWMFFVGFMGVGAVGSYVAVPLKKQPEMAAKR